MLTGVLALVLSASLGIGRVRQTPSSALPAVRLERKWTVGQTSEYAVKAEYTTEGRSGLEMTFAPSDLTISYRFTLNVVKAKADGIVDAIYRRPTMVQTIGDTVDRGPVSRTEKSNSLVRLTLSPINEVLDAKEEKVRRRNPLSQGADAQIAAAIGQFVGEIQRLSFFVGGFDTALDIAPRLPLTPVKPGDTWERTVGYAPQSLKGKGGKLVNQRLDYKYRYVGRVSSRGKSVDRIVATLAWKADLAEFGRQIAGETHSSEIVKAPIALDATIEFDLDPATRQTIRAVANAKNSYQIYLSDFEGPIQEERANGITTLTLVSRRPAGSAKPK